MVEHVTKRRAVFLFPGQGAQKPGMALDIYEESAAARELFALASDVLGRDMRRTLAESDAEALKETELAQGAITLAGLAAAAFLGERGLRACATAGHSLGEYAALATAGVLSARDCFALVRERGRLMARAALEAGEAGMAAVIGLSSGEVLRVVESARAEGEDGLFAANLNAPRQTVISGTAAALARAEARFKAAGARRVLPLKVSGPFHSPLMREAAERFEEFARPVAFNDPAIPFFSNVTGARVGTGAEAKALAPRQITSAVRWTDIEAGLAGLGADAVLETGPGSVLSGLWADSGASPPCRPAGTANAIKEL